jgi:hypothetical protein
VSYLWQRYEKGKIVVAISFVNQKMEAVRFSKKMIKIALDGKFK